MSVGEKIRFYRKQKRLTQKELAEKAGVASASINRYEYDLREPSAKALMSIAQVLNVSIYVFFDGTKLFPKKEKCPPSSISMSEANINNPILIIPHQGGKINDIF